MIRIEVGLKSGNKFRFKVSAWRATLGSGNRSYSFSDMTPKAVFDLDAIEYVREV